jgi:hypothetical protein
MYRPPHIPENPMGFGSSSLSRSTGSSGYHRGLLKKFEEDSKAKEKARKAKDTSKPPSVSKKNPWMAKPKFPSGNVPGLKPVWKGGAAPAKPTGRHGSFPTTTAPKKPWVDPDIGTSKPPKKDKPKVCPGNQVKDAKGNCVDPKDDDCASGKRYADGSCITDCADTHGEEYVGTYPDCELKNDGTCAEGCGDNEVCKDGDCIPKPPGQPPGGPGGPSENTITKPDWDYELAALTDEMDIRNMLNDVINKNNPLFKQARTRALQAMAARGVVNSSMAEESVMSAIMDVAMPIAEKAVNDLQKVMYANVNASNEFKMQLNNIYMQELMNRINNAANFRLNYMQQSAENWRSMLAARAKAADMSDEGVYNKYMDMLGNQNWSYS